MKFQNTLGSLLILSCLLGFAGCKQQSTTTTPGPTASPRDDAGHGHADGDDHSVLGHAHGAGPHGGVIADWGGGKYHVEFTVDHDKQQATVYILGADESSSVPIDTESIDLSINEPAMQIELKAAAQDSDPAGTSSRFAGTHEKLGVVQEYAGTISGVIDGTPYFGDFAEDAHEHE